MKYYETQVLRVKNYDDLDNQLNELPKTYSVVAYRESSGGDLYTATITFLIND